MFSIRINVIESFAKDYPSVSQLLKDPALQEKYMSFANRKEIETEFPHIMDGKIIVIGAGENGIGIYLRFAQLLPIKRKYENPFLEDTVLRYAKIYALNKEIETLAIGSKIYGRLRLVQTLNESENFPIARRLRQSAFLSKGGKPVFENIILDPEGRNDLIIEGSEIISIQETKREKLLHKFYEAARRLALLNSKKYLL